MSDIIHLTRKAYHFGSAVVLTPQNVDRLIDQFTTASDADVGSVLGGRRSVSILSLDGIGSVVVKHYRRGGLLARVNKKIYLRTGKPRCQLEYEQMLLARSFGVATPEPVAYVYRGGLLYQGWLLTKEITGQKSLAELSTQDPDRAEMVIPVLGAQVERLIANKIRHADFHPGNVLVNNSNQVFIIDFDKAHSFTGSRRQLKERYGERWRRAIHKHHLPKILDDKMHPFI